MLDHNNYYYSDLYNELKKLRLEIAIEENVPPFNIFDNKTLLEMSQKHPLNLDDMLKLSGLSYYKFAKYGDSFITLIKKYLIKHPYLLQYKTKLHRLEERKLFFENKNTKDNLPEFYLLKEEASSFNYKDFYTISEIRNEMNSISKRVYAKKISTIELMNFLFVSELIVKKEYRGKFYTFPTDKGLNFGIKTINKVSKNGFSYKVIIYPLNVQRMIVHHYTK